jgi:DnaJ family protein C protein 11
LAGDFDLRLAFFGAFIPATAAIALEQLFLKPRRKRLIKE